jgi:hypothetical protein
MGGMQASRAISGYPQVIEGEFDIAPLGADSLAA